MSGYSDIIIDYTIPVQWISMLIVIFVFSAHVIFSLIWSRKYTLTRLDIGSSEKTLGLILPCWNEELIIEGKLDDVAKQKFPRDRLTVLIIDSASTDQTMPKVRKWLDNNIDSLGPKVIVIEEEERKGKASALNRAIGEIIDTVDIIAMSDIDARLSNDSLLRLASWFEDPQIGAVCGRSVMLQKEGSGEVRQEESYRGFHDLMRQGESCADSTPIFEGSIAGFRSSVLEDPYLDTKTISDDSELAVKIRNRGYRAIQDNEIEFYEAPSTNDSFFSQKVRRAQGLVRMFVINWRVWFRPRYSRWGQIMGSLGLMHVILPWIFLIGIFSGLFNSLNNLYEVGLSLNFDMEGITTAFNFLFLISYFFGMTRISPNFARIITTFVNYNAIIITAQFQLIIGNSMHKWDQVKSVREVISEMENDTP